MKMRNTQTRLIIIAILIVIFIFVITSILSTILELDYSQNIATAGLLFAVGAFAGVLYSLNATYIQLRKSMAKPIIKVAFNERGEQQAILTYKQLENSLLPLCLINEGNAVAKYFQIDLIIPENVGKQSTYKIIARYDSDYIVSHINDGNPLFVNKAHQGPDISHAIDKKKVRESCIDSIIIRYKIYGDWAETQEGKLKIIINQQEESPNANS